jgi:hypothetical protein
MQDFTRGPYGEIFPPPLGVSGLDPDEALDMLAMDSGSESGPAPMPTRGKRRVGMVNLAVFHIHQQTLKGVLGGQWGDDPDEEAIYKAVVENGEPMSLRPLGFESLYFSSFAPVLKRVEGDRWRVGLPGFGKDLLIEGTPPEVLENAWATFAKWSDEEETHLTRTLDKLLSAFPQSINHEVWGITMRMGQAAILGEAAGVEWLGKHDVFRVTVNEGQRLIRTSSPERAARMTEIMARQVKQSIRYPDAGQIVDLLLASGEMTGPVPKIEGAWRIGKLGATWRGEGKFLALLTNGKEGIYHLTMEKSEIQVAAINGKKSTKIIGRSALASNLAEFQKTDDGRRALCVWAATKIQQRRK